MRSFRLDPYLWIHLAGAAAVPIFLELCFLGLAAGDPVLPIGLEFLLVAVVGIAPVFWMQWQRPFYIFSLLVVAIKPDQLTDEQRRLLRLFKTTPVKALTVVVSGVLAIALWKLFHAPPLDAASITFLPQWRLGGLLIGAIAFLLSNVFLQVPASVLRVLLATESQIDADDAYPVEHIPQDFSIIGLRVAKILPDMVVETPQPATEGAAASSSGLDTTSEKSAAGVTDQPKQPSSEAAPPVSPPEAVPATEAPSDSDESSEKSVPQPDETGETTETVAHDADHEDASETGDASSEDASAQPVDELADTLPDHPDTMSDADADALETDTDSKAETHEAEDPHKPNITQSINPDEPEPPSN
ncbi:MAG: low-complexity tail membrane protein [Elainellaceae cyanobacterium]